MKQLNSFSLLWFWLLLLSSLNAQKSIPTVDISGICPPLVTSPAKENHVRVRYKSAVLPLADDRAVVFPCQLKMEKRTPGKKMYSYPDQSIVIHYVNATSEVYNYSHRDFRPCRDFITLQPELNLDMITCNLPETNYRESQFLFWSKDEADVQLHLSNYNVSSGDANYLQIYMTILSDNSHECRVQQYDLAKNFPTSCQSKDYQLGRFCAEFDCVLFNKGRFQSLLNTTHTPVKLLKVSRDEIFRVIVATICPIFIVCLLILLTCFLVSCCRVSESSLTTYNDEETTKTSVDDH